ncbi:hypothetical protein HDU76_008674, partial [Blyttiomyces sp. JEL0837]
TSASLRAHAKLAGNIYYHTTTTGSTTITVESYPATTSGATPSSESTDAASVSSHIDNTSTTTPPSITTPSASEQQTHPPTTKDATIPSMYSHTNPSPSIPSYQPTTTTTLLTILPNIAPTPIFSRPTYKPPLPPIIPQRPPFDINYHNYNNDYNSPHQPINFNKQPPSNAPTVEPYIPTDTCTNSLAKFYTHIQQCGKLMPSQISTIGIQHSYPTTTTTTIKNNENLNNCLCSFETYNGYMELERECTGGENNAGGVNVIVVDDDDE